MSSFLSSGRTIRSADSLSGPRIYSTDLLPNLFDKGAPDESIQVTARALKVKIITKGLVTLNAAYLLSPLGVRLIDAYPDLLEGSAILPAFRTDKESLEDLIESSGGHAEAGIDDKQLADHIARLNVTIKQVMPWELGEVGERFRSLLLGGLSNPQTLIARELQDAGLEAEDLDRIRGDIEGLDLSASANLRNYTSGLPEKVKTAFDRFSAASYHLIGTGVVRCEAGTDLNPLSAFKAADLVLAGRDSEPEVLSEEAIFIEAFMSFAMDTIDAIAAPTEVIDAIGFSAVHQISEALRASDFQGKYDGVIRSYRNSADLPDSREALESLDAESIANVAAALGEQFKSAVLAEIPEYKTATQQAAKQGVIRSGADVAKDFVNLIPGVSTIVSVAEGLEHGAKAVTAGQELLSVRDLSAAVAKAKENRVIKLREAINKLPTGKEKKATLLDGVALLADAHGIAVARA